MNRPIVAILAMEVVLLINSQIPWAIANEADPPETKSKNMRGKENAGVKNAYSKPQSNSRRVREELEACEKEVVSCKNQIARLQQEKAHMENELSESAKAIHSLRSRNDILAQSLREKTVEAKKLGDNIKKCQDALKQFINPIVIPGPSSSEWRHLEDTTIRENITGAVKKGHILKTISGGIYEVVEYVYLYEYEYSPNVVILTNGNLYKLIIEGFEEPLVCQKLNIQNNESMSSSPPVQGPAVIESHISSDFQGLEYGNVYRLANGQLWEQTDSWIWVWIWFNPKVTIYQSGGVYKMKVEKIDHAVSVRRLK